MRIHFERSGGFAGITLSVTIETDTLPPGDAEELQRLVERAGFFDLPATIADTTPVADQFVYRVTVEADARSHTVETSEGAAPSTLRPLLDWLNRATRRARR
jgi:hypothetical protein